MKAPKKDPKPKAAKPKKAAKTKPEAPGMTPAPTASVVDLPTKTKVAAKPATPGTGTNQLTDEQKRALALRHAEKLKGHKEAVAKASGSLRAFLKEAKSDGFSKAILEAVLLAQTPEGEAVLKERIATQLQGAKWAGQPFGDLLAHLESPDLTPAIDRARDEGKMASMQNKPAQPGYHASTPQYAAYMEGYHAHQETLLKNGIKPLDEATPADADASEFSEVDPDDDISGDKVFRSEYERVKTAEGSKPVDDFA